MRHRIDPKVDCVFKALLGAEVNRGLLIHFLNAVLGAELPRPITTVEILNPYNEKEFLDDKLSIVDVKARDIDGCLYQIELQLLNHRDLPARITYGWADLYASQLNAGQDYALLRPTYAIWLLGEALLPDEPGYAHDIRLRDATGRMFGEHGGIRLLEIGKFAGEAVHTEQERWLKFFKEGVALDPEHLPPWMNTPEMRQVMSTLSTFSEKDRAYHAYQARQEFLRVQRAMQQDMEERTRALEQAEAKLHQTQTDLEQARAAVEQARAAAEQERATAEQERATAAQERAAAEQERATAAQERAAKEQALAELARLRATLDQQNDS
jgi:predicted transposase/invertase (TIGR01784 family)